jgi:hypothetical protein
MRQRRGEVTTAMVNLTEVSLKELGRSVDPVLRRSVLTFAERAACGHTGVLQNQMRDRH